MIKLNWALLYQHPRMVRISGARQTVYLARINRNRLSESRSLTMTMAMAMAMAMSMVPLCLEVKWASTFSDAKTWANQDVTQKQKVAVGCSKSLAQMEMGSSTRVDCDKGRFLPYVSSPTAPGRLIVPVSDHSVKAIVVCSRPQDSRGGLVW